MREGQCTSVPNRKGFPMVGQVQKRKHFAWNQKACTGEFAITGQNGARMWKSLAQPPLPVERTKILGTV
jgi:hypothetical protein